MPETGIEYTLLRAVRFAADRHRSQDAHPGLAEEFDAICQEGFAMVE